MGSEDLASNTEMWYSNCLRTAAVRMRAHMGLDEKEWVREHVTLLYDFISQATRDGDFYSAAYAFQAYNQAKQWLRERGA